MTKLTLRCLIVGEEGNFEIECASHRTVLNLKQTIQTCKSSRIQCDHRVLKLYLATVESEEGMKWIPYDEAMQKLTKDVVPTQVQDKYLAPEMLLKDNTLLTEYFPCQPTLDRKIHLFVLLPFHAKPIPVSRQKLCRVQVLHTNGIDYSLHNYIERIGLATRLHNMMGSSQIVVLAAPKSTGKTSLIQLTQQRFQFRCRMLDCRLGDDPFALLLSTGIDLQNQKVLVDEHKLFVIALDDAHNVFGSPSFWTHLVVDAAKWLPPNFKFIVSTKHVLPPRAPMELANLPRLYRSDFLLSEKEVYQVIDQCWSGNARMISDCKRLRTMIVREASGIIGIVRYHVAALSRHFYQKMPTEKELEEFCFTDGFLRGMHVIFSISVGHSPAELRRFLRSCYLAAVPMPVFREEESRHTFLDLQEEGVLVETNSMCFRIGTLMAERFYFKDVFSSYY